ncbi:hypothetical protein ACE6H2_008000 [Prunus campanulata]
MEDVIEELLQNQNQPACYHIQDHHPQNLQENLHLIFIGELQSHPHYLHTALPYSDLPLPHAFNLPSS